MKGRFDGKGPKFRQIEVTKHRHKVCEDAIEPSADAQANPAYQ